MVFSNLRFRSGGDGLGRALEQLPTSPRPFWAALGAHHLTGLDHLLEPAQIVADLLVRRLTEKLGHGVPELAGGRSVSQVDADFGAPVSWRWAGTRPGPCSRQSRRLLTAT